MRKLAKTEARNRLTRMEGQVRGLLNMIEDERPCTDVLTQVAALRAALEGFGSFVVASHLDELIGQCTPLRGADWHEEKLNDIRNALERLIR